MNKEYVKGLIDMAICAVSEYELPGDDSGLTFHVENTEIVAFWSIGRTLVYAGSYNNAPEWEPVLKSDSLNISGMKPEKAISEVYLFVLSCVKF